MSEANAPLQPGPDTGRETGTVVRRSWRMRMIGYACLAAILGLSITILHLLWPTALMFALFMTLGQGAFGAAMIVYAIVIFSDLRRRKVL